MSKTGLCGLWLLLLASTEVYAAQVMEEVVVTATRSEKLFRTNPWSVSVLNKEQLQAQTGDQLADVLRDLPGLLVSDAGQAGQKRIRIRGEEARRMALLIDGQEFIDHREVGVPLLVDTANLSRIEVVRGPASVLYGPKAMGGVINVITTGEHASPLDGRVSVNYNSATAGELYSGNLGGRAGDTDWQVSFTDNHQHERDTPDGNIENTAYTSRGYSASVRQFVSDHMFGIGIEKFESSSGVYVDPAVRFTPPFLDFGIDIPVRDRDKVRVDYRFSRSVGSLESVNVDAYRQTSDREFNTTTLVEPVPGLLVDTFIGTVSQLVSTGANVQSNWQFGSYHSVVAGFQYVGDVIDQNRHRTSETSGVPTTDETVLDSAKLNTNALYVQDDWTLTPSLSMLVGARTYAVDGRLTASTRLPVLPEFSDDETIASVALVYEVSPQTTLRANLAQGYIYPSLLNLAIGAFAGPRFVNPVATLKPESSITQEVGMRFADERFTVDATLFHTRADDYIDHVSCQATDNCLTAADEIYKNVGQATSFGVEVFAQVELDAFDLYTNLTWLRRHKNDEGVDTYNTGVPRLSGRLGVRRELRRAIDLDVFTRFESSADETEATRSGFRTSRYPGFVTVNANLGWSLRNRYRFRLGLGNLLDKRYSSATENLLAPGRHIMARLAVDL